MEYLILGLALAFNLLVIKEKYQRGRTEDATLDFALLAVITYFFSGSYGALVIGTIASAFISVWLFFNPPKFA